MQEVQTNESHQGSIKGLIDLNPKSAEFLALANNKLKFKLFMLAKLPLAFIAGLRVEEATEHSCKVSVPFRWLTQNPFRSTYFAALTMAAELSTGLPSSAALNKYPGKATMLLSKVEGQFTKKSKSRITFCCEDFQPIIQAVQRSEISGAWEQAAVETIGYNGDQEEVARFQLEWAFKITKKREV